MVKESFLPFIIIIIIIIMIISITIIIIIIIIITKSRIYGKRKNNHNPPRAYTVTRNK
jgi:heme/copper-type cytochrome/quinol oxidase subunit 2